MLSKIATKTKTWIFPRQKHFPNLLREASTLVVVNHKALEILNDKATQVRRVFTATSVLVVSTHAPQIEADLAPDFLRPHLEGIVVFNFVQ